MSTGHKPPEAGPASTVGEVLHATAEPKVELAGGGPVTPDHRELKPNGQQKGYIVLSPAEGAKGFVRPYRDSYVHVGICGPQHVQRELTPDEHERYDRYGYVSFEAYPEPNPDGSSVTGKFWTQAELDKIGKGLWDAHEDVARYLRNVRAQSNVLWRDLLHRLRQTPSGRRIRLGRHRQARRIMTNITKPTATELVKWRTQALRAAAHLKGGSAKPKPGQNFIRTGFAFDDDRTGLRLISLDIPIPDIERLSADELAETIYDGVLAKALEHTPAAGHA